jgi:dTDP-4-amino-4,6-dideoxygalactose transaminase
MWEHTGLRLEDPGLKETEKICREVISLPMSAETTEEQVQITADAIRGFFTCQRTAELAEVTT